MAGTMHGARGGTRSWPLGVTGKRQEKAGPVQRGLIAFAPVKVVPAFSSTLNHKEGLISGLLHRLRGRS